MELSLPKASVSSLLPFSTCSMTLYAASLEASGTVSLLDERDAVRRMMISLSSLPLTARDGGGIGRER